ncbi:MAG: hypothetical protein PHY56_00790 [Candidatus Omnitrophica bacterium]|nr:hypothetical protein [Candidatus Omnitrophota bacterium]
MNKKLLLALLISILLNLVLWRSLKIEINANLYQQKISNSRIKVYEDFFSDNPIFGWGNKEG